MNANQQDDKRSDKPHHPPYLQNRELSWLDFNKRVLDQGADDTVPLLERLNFISIFWSNLKEFFMIRVGSLTDLSLVKKLIIDQKSGMTPAEQLDAIYERCHELYPYYEKVYKDLRKLLIDEGITHMHKADLDDKTHAYLDKYVHDNIMPVLSPQIINTRHPFPHLENGRLYIVVRLNDIKPKEEKEKENAEKEAHNTETDSSAIEEDKSDATDQHGEHKHDSQASNSSKNLGAEGVTLGLIPLPTQCERIVKLPGKRFRFVLLETAIEMYADEIFSMYKVKHTNVICVTRNADLDATEGTEEQGEDYREHMKRILKKRARLAPVRLESQRPLSPTVKPVLLERLNLKEHQVFVSSVPLDMSYTFDLEKYLSPEKRDALTNVPFTPSWPASLERGRSITEQVSQHEVLLSYPYESMDPFVQLLREAANDPSVLSIKITLYRLANQSHIAEALIAAAEAGKEVTALFELRARFDESNNIEWSQRFEQAGCHVIYGFRENKVHSKICAITRQTKNGLQYITQLGTGNYNEKTARLYTDMSFITTDPLIGQDAVRFFHNMALENTSDSYDILWVAPLQIKQNILIQIDEQIAQAKAGKPSGLFFKSNSVTDLDIMEKIVEASQAGVPCTLFVRGISCIVPKVKGYTDNVRVVSIVGRLLEHSRIFCFGPKSSCKIYLSSADIMTRNMDKRIEIAWPVLNKQLHDEILGYLMTCMADTAKLRELLPDKSYTPLGYFAKKRKKKAKANAYSEEDSANTTTNYLQSNDKKPGLFDAQSVLIEEAQQKHLIAAELRAARIANRSDDDNYFTGDSKNGNNAPTQATMFEDEVEKSSRNTDDINRSEYHDKHDQNPTDQTSKDSENNAVPQTPIKPKNGNVDAASKSEKPKTSSQSSDMIEVEPTSVEIIPLRRREPGGLGRFGSIAGNALKNIASTIMPAAQNAARAAAPVARDAAKGAGRVALFAAANAASTAITLTSMLVSNAVDSINNATNHEDTQQNEDTEDPQENK